MQIEIKVKVGNAKGIFKIIKKLGAKFWAKTKETDTYFFSKKGVLLLKTVTNGECLLVHDYRPNNSLTTALRTELPLDSIFAEKLLSILDDTVGKKLVLQREKEEYIYHGMLLALDRIKEHETFLEITSDEIQKSGQVEEKKKLLNVLLRFGYLEKDLETKSYVDMYL